ncbi:ammonia-forming cytochrome c nitrite reductase subunit c552, partial [bacterium]|nr:ammonia-forming cytochrome c nitrite reductase subunit c552 [bacterium]
MALSETSRRGSVVALLFGGVRAFINLALTVAAIWLTYSRFFIDHTVALPPALDADRRDVILNDAGRCSYYVVPGTGRPLVLVHSINAAPSAYEMKPLFDHYRGTRPVYALDLPGFGFSERRDRRYSPNLFTATISDFLATVVEPAHGLPVDLVGLSLGSEYVAMTAHRHPQRVASLALISPTGFNPEPIELPEQTIYSVLSFRLWSQGLYDLIVLRSSIDLFLGRNFAGEPDPDMIDYAYWTSHQPGARFAPLHFLSGQLFTQDVRESVYSKLERYPAMVTLWAGYAFSIDHNEERGHYYANIDQAETERVAVVNQP